MSEPRIDLEEMIPLYQQLSKKFGKEFPDYVVMKKELKSLGSHASYWGNTKIGGNLPDDHNKRLLIEPGIDGVYLGSENVIILIADPKEQVSVVTAIHEFIEYRNKQEGITMTEDEIDQEALIISKEYGYSD